MTTKDDYDILARTLYGEADARNEDDAVAVASTVMNRVGYPNWPNTAEAVCVQPWQFSCWNSNDPGRARILAATEKDKWFARCMEIAKSALEGKLVDPTGGATHYYATYIAAPKWSRGKKPCYETSVVGGKYKHRYYNNIDTRPPETAREALDEDRPLTSTRTVKGGQVAGGAGAVATAAGVVASAAPALPVLSWIRENIGTSLIVIGVAVLIGVGIMLAARIDDRNKGLR